MTGDVTEHDATTPGHRRTQLCVRRAVSGVGSRLAWVENTSLTPVSSHLGTAFRDAPGFAQSQSRGLYAGPIGHVMWFLRRATVDGRTSIDPIRPADMMMI